MLGEVDGGAVEGIEDHAGEGDDDGGDDGDGDESACKGAVLSLLLVAQQLEGVEEIHLLHYLLQTDRDHHH